MPFHPLRLFRVLATGGFTLVELLAVIAIIALLAALLIPVSNSMIGSAREAKCIGNLRQMGIGFAGYLAENNGRFPQQRAGVPDPSQPNWWGAIGPYIDWPTNKYTPGNIWAGTIGHCPNHTEKPESFSYQGNHAFITQPSGDPVALVSVTKPHLKILVLEVHTTSHWPITGSAGWAGKTPFSPPWKGHGAHGKGEGRNNSLYVDLHVESAPADGSTRHWVPTPTYP